MSARVLGAAAVTLAALLLGRIWGERLLSRERELLALCELVDYMACRMQNGLLPLYVIYGEYLRIHPNDAFARELLASEAGGAPTLRYQKKELVAAAREFFSFVGGGFIEEEKRRTELFFTRITKEHEKAKQDAQTKAPLYRSLFLVGGLTVVTLLI